MFTLVLTSMSRTILGTLVALYNSQLSSVSKLGRLNSSSPWSFVHSSLANNLRSQQQMVILPQQSFNTLQRTLVNGCG